MALDVQAKLFDELYVEDCGGNVFEAICKFSTDAEKVKAKTEGRLSNSEALSAVLNKALPENTFNRQRVETMEQLYIERYIREVLSQIDDIAVRYSVSQTLQKSKAEKNLVFTYLDALSPAQRARVRIISKLVWYNLYPKGDANNV